MVEEFTMQVVHQGNKMKVQGSRIKRSALYQGWSLIMCYVESVNYSVCCGMLVKAVNILKSIR